MVAEVVAVAVVAVVVEARQLGLCVFSHNIYWDFRLDLPTQASSNSGSDTCLAGLGDGIVLGFGSRVDKPQEYLAGFLG